MAEISILERIDKENLCRRCLENRGENKYWCQRCIDEVEGRKDK